MQLGNGSDMAYSDALTDIVREAIIISFFFGLP
jgi:hypothetical protein